MTFNLRSGTRWVLIGAVAAALAVTAVMRLVTAAVPEPAMWVVKDRDSTIYLLGTLHLLKPGTAWRTDKVAEAFAASDEVWLEASQLDSPEVQALVMYHGFDYERPLADRLAPEAKTRLDAVAAEIGLQPESLEHMRPWLAALTISLSQAMQSGYDMAHGVDQVLETDATKAGKRVMTFATPEQHVMIYGGLPEVAEIEFLMMSLIDMQEMQTQIDQIAAAWVAGNAKELDRLALAPMLEEGPHFFDAVITRRNIAWTEQIAARMAGAGTSFVAVGAGHLVGQDGLPSLLAARGFAVAPY